MDALFALYIRRIWLISNHVRSTITDLSWDGEGKRIAVSGNGDKKGAAFSWDTGACIDKGTVCRP